MAIVSRLDLFAQVAARLAGISTATGYYGAVGRNLDGTLGGDPPLKSDGSQRVTPYYVIYPSAGSPGPDPDLGDCNVDITAPFQVTAAAGDIADLLALVDDILNRLLRWAPSLAGTHVGPIGYPPGFTAPPHLLDNQFTPPRLFVPIPLQLTATT